MAETQPIASRSESTGTLDAEEEDEVAPSSLASEAKTGDVQPEVDETPKKEKEEATSTTAALAPTTTGPAGTSHPEQQDQDDGVGQLPERPTQAEVLQIRALLGRLQKQIVDARHAANEKKLAGESDKMLVDASEAASAASSDSDEIKVKLSQAEVELLAHLFGRGLIRAPSRLSTRPQVEREMTATAFAQLLARVQDDKQWPVSVAYKDLTYSVNVPAADVGIATVGTQLYAMLSPLWKWAWRARSERVDLPIIQGISGSFMPGRSTLVLGPPGCGVSTLFKILTKRAKVDKKLHKLSGDVLYSGYTDQEVNVRRFSNLVDQVDEHLAVLTVTETLDFAHECFGSANSVDDNFKAPGGEVTDEELARVKELTDQFVQFVIHNMALDNAKDTIVGNDLLRGVSGGERKRVTTAEMIMSRRPLSFYDQISTGLDSAATFDICRRITGVAQRLNLTPVIALLQPPPEVYDLFDEIMILARGHVVYHGPREQVIPYFSSIGFDCPADRDIADFIQEVTTDARTRYQTRDDVPASEKAMAEAWLASSFSESKRAEVERLFEPDSKVSSQWRDERYAIEQPVFARSRFEELKLVLRRQVQLVLRDPAFVKARIGQSVVMGIIISTVFLDIPDNVPDGSGSGDTAAVTQRYGLIFTVLMQSMLAGMAQLPVVLGQRPIYYKQSNAYMYRTGNYVVSEFLSVVPISIVESIILGTFTFWIPGIVPFGASSPTGSQDAGGIYILWLLMLITLNISFSAYIRAIATFVQGAAVAQVVAGISIAASVLMSGFILTVGTIPPWFIWIYWLSPVAWGLRSMIILVFQSKTFSAAQSDFALGLFEFQDNKEYVWGGFLVLLLYMVLNGVLSCLGYNFVRFTSGGGRQTKVNPGAESQDPDIAEVERVESQTNARLASEAAKAVDGEVQLEVQRSAISETFEPVDLVFRDIWYSVQGPTDKKGQYNLDLLKGITGFAEAGTLTCLMGSSGAGKSTLMDVIAGRKTSGEIKGDILVNGRPQDKLSFSRIIGYVEQNDIHSPNATVHEALIFSAYLRQPDDVPREEKDRFVEGVIETLALEPIRDFEIGFKTSGGLSTEQAKRLTIGVELAANPAIIFADEPTSGLDASSAVVVMDGLERIAKMGRTVVCTIHQPSKDIFVKFDRLLLLKRGGEMVYFGDLGENASQLVDYLHAIPGTVPMQPRENPATYMLIEVGRAASGESVVDFPFEYSQSDLRVENEAKLDALVERNLQDRKEVVFDRQFATGFGPQFEQLMKRWFWGYWRSPAYNLTRLLVSFLMAIFFGCAFLGKGSVSTVQDVQSFVGLCFMSAAFMSVIYLNTSIPTMAVERPAFYRERAAGYYSVMPMVSAITLAELPYILVSSFVFMVPFYYIVGLYQDATAFMLFWLVYFLLLTTITFFGHFLAAVAPNEQVAAVLGAVCIGLFTLTAGLTIAVPDITTFWQFLPAINPLRYALNGLVVVQLGCDDPVASAGSPGCTALVGDDGQPLGITAWQLTQNSFGFEEDDLAADFGALVGFTVGFRLLAVWAYYSVSYLKR